MNNIDLLFEKEIEWIENNYYVNKYDLNRVKQEWSEHIINSIDDETYFKLYADYIYPLINKIYNITVIKFISNNKLQEVIISIKKYYTLRVFQ